MKAVILAGGKGLRLFEETKNIPKPMVNIGTNPILWHIMKIYSYYGIKDFIICAGYKKEIIKEYFKKYFNNTEQWKIVIVDTGIKTLTGGRLKRVEKLVSKEKIFFFT